MIEMRQLRAFVAVAEEQHFGRAATRLHLSQPALSRTVAGLEARIGVTLLERTTRRVTPTPAGAALLDRARDLLADADDAVETARRAARGLAGRLRVAYMDFAILGALPALVAGFRRRYPEVAVELRYSWTERQRGEILDGSVDVGFLIGPFPAAHVSTRVVARERFVAVLPAAHPLAASPQLELAQLAREQFVFGVPEEWGPLHAAVTRLCNGAGFAPDVVQEAHSRDGIFGFVAAGLGITLYTESAYSSPRQGIVIRPLADVSEELEILAAWRSGSGSPARERFVTHLETSIPVPASGVRPVTGTGDAGQPPARP